MTRDRDARLVYSTGGGRAHAREEPAPSPAPGKGGVRLRLERWASGRVVTIVTGLPGRREEVAALARTLKTTCGTGGTVKEGTLELQGDQRERVEAALRARGLRFARAGG